MKRILVVDDDNMSLRMAEHVLSPDYIVDTAASGKEALNYLNDNIPDLILMDINMPDMDGKETSRLIRSQEVLADIPIIFLTADTNPDTEIACINAGADDFITKPFVPTVMIARVNRIIELHDFRTNLEGMLVEKSKQIEMITLNSIMSIAHTIDAKDKYTGGHSIRVAKCASDIAKHLDWTDDEIQNFHSVALLHDIGKIGIPESILNKPTRLTDEEFEIIKKHTSIGSDILKDIHNIEHVQEGALYHHEKYNGKGYPAGLYGDDIPLYARIICIADSYDAMSTNRVYRKHLSTEQIIQEFERCRGIQFDPELTDIFIQMLKDGYSINDDTIGDNLTDESSLLLNKVIDKYTEEASIVSMTDGLTGLYNRNYLNSQETELFGNSAGSFFMIDLDNFKYVNDQYGHIMGDKTLQLFADALKNSCGENDFACRLGGDEFAIVFREMDSSDAVNSKAESLLEDIKTAFSSLEYSSVISASIGIAMYPANGNDFATLYRNADKALYYVKNNGKNSYHLFDTENSEQNYHTEADINNVRMMIEGRMDISKGSFCVAYQEFKKIYNFISRYVQRNPNMAQIILLTLHNTSTDSSNDNITMDYGMKVLEEIIKISLRSADVGTKYSSSQYVLVLVNTNFENGNMVAQRLVEKFYRTYHKSDIKLTYDIQTIESNVESNI